jgi:hypothetical protein
MWQVGQLALSSFLALAPQAAPPTRAVDYDGLAREFLKESGLDDIARSGPSGHSFDELLDGPAFVRLNVGDLDIRFPRTSIADASKAEDFRDAVGALVRMQKTWSAWRWPERAEANEPHWNRIERWVKAWSRNSLVGAAGGRSLVESMSADSDVRAALEALEQGVDVREASSSEGPVVASGRLLLTMDRKAYLQLLSLGGWLDDQVRAVAWDDRVLGSTIQWIGWTQLVCMEFASLPVDPKSPYAGISLTKGDKNDLLQYAAERGAALQLRRLFHNQQVHFFEQSLAANLVIAAAGKNDLREGDWKLEYKTSGSSTPPYERFVPGGNPAGGTLPPRPAGPGATTGNATNKASYRATKGEDLFLKPLREGQKDGAKLAAKDKKNPLRKDKTAHFAIHGAEGKEATSVSAPFLGDRAEKKALPGDEYLDDYEDFFRAYRSAFFHWLHDEALDDPAESAAKFSTLIAEHAVRDPLTPIDPLFETIYGIPLSATDGETDSLEWRYLAWLAKKKR